MKQKLLLSAFLFTVSFQTLSQPGAPDPAFGTSGWAYFTGTEPQSGFTNMGIQPDGKIIVHRRGYLGRYNTNGTLDNSFGTNGWKRLDHGAVDMAIQTDGSILLLASHESIGRIFKHNASNGAIDETWGNEGSVTIELPAVALRYNSIVLDSKGRIIVAGRATFGTDPIFRTPSVARLNADGSLDTEFNGTGIRNQLFLDFLSRGAMECGVDGSDKIVISVGVTGEVNDIILKYNTDGKLDLSFGGGDGELDTNRDIDRLAVNTNGKIGYTTIGEFDQATLDFYYYYLNADGSYINDGFIFNITGLTAITFQPDGKLVVAGHYLSRLFFIRHHTDGSVDQSFLNDEMDLDYNIIPKELVYFNRRLFVAGFYPVLYGGLGVVLDADGFILALDATDKRLKCNTFGAGDLQPNADPGKCYKTINDSRFDPAFIPSTATGTVNYQLLRNGIVVEQGTGSVNGKDFQVGATQVKYSYTDITTHSCTFTVTVLDKQLPVAKTKNITAQLNSSGATSITAANVDDGSTDNCGIKSMSLSKTSFDCSNVGANTITFTIIDNSNNTSTATATVTVEDKIAPDVKCKNLRTALDADGNASIVSNQIDDGSTDACGIKSLSLSKTTFDCTNKGNNQVTLTATDNNNNTSTCTASVTVVDEIVPSILSITPSPAFLWPSDRKMKPVTINASIWDNCPGATYRITDVSIKAGIFANDNINPDWEITGDHTVNLRAEIPKKGTSRIYTVTITCTDAEGNSTTGSVDVVAGHTIISPASGATIKVGSTASLSGNYWDVPGKKHTAKWTIDENVTINGSLTEPSGQTNGTVKGSYKFNTTGVYKIQMNVTDQNGKLTYANTNDNLEAIVVVYDPNGGYSYGGGNFHSPTGALSSNPAATGDASYGFTVNYYKNATQPKGETQFGFKVGDFEFNALNFDYLVISNSMAQFKGSGKIIGGQSGVAFTMTVVDGQLDGTGVDKIRMKIYNKNNGRVIYDNQPGASDAAFPVQAVGTNSTVVICSSSNSGLTSANTNQKAETEARIEEVPDGLDVIAFPNPSADNFTINVKASSNKEKITMQVIDMYGRVTETRNINAASMIRFGERYRPGTYFVRIIQGKKHKEIKLIKLAD